MGKALVVMTLFLFLLAPCVAFGDRITFQWDTNTESDLAGYRLFERQGSAAYVYGTPSWQGGGTTCTIDKVYTPGETYHWVLRAFDTSGNESADSNEVSLTIPVPDVTGPDAPTLSIPIYIKVGN